MRELFPQLSELVYGKPLVYLDNAATALRPQSVIDCWTELSSKKNANLHRAVHHIAEIATGKYEEARDCVKNFINAKNREEIIFTSGTTAAINLVAFSFGEEFIKEGDEIIVTEAEHHSNIVPWQMLCERKGAVLKHIDVNDNGVLQFERLDEMISSRTRLVCVTHISNVLGLVNPVKSIVELCHAKDCPVLVDGAQGIVHSKVDVQDIGCDFYVFSGHKIYSSPGVGVLYGRKELLDRMPPYMGGGEMIGEVKWKGFTCAPLPQKFEAGTQNMAGVPTLVPALEAAEKLRQYTSEQDAVRDYVLAELTRDSRIRLFGVPEAGVEKIPLFSFVINGAHHEDVALILDKMGVAVRSGQMCAEPLMDRFGVTGMLRASFAPYNTLEEAEFFIKSLDKAIKMLV